MAKIESVDEYLEKHSNFFEGLSILRRIIKQTKLEETIKWSAPVYTLNNKNVLGLGAFKNHFGIWFFNGVFLKDEYNLLENAQEGKTKALRQMKFTDSNEIKENLVLEYVREAILNQEQGKELKPKKTKPAEVEIPKELEESLKSDSNLKKSFESLSPYRQKEYSEYIRTAKRDSTKQSRLQKIVPMIKKGIGLHDKYKNC